jgi:hypothetical protein
MAGGNLGQQPFLPLADKLDAAKYLPFEPRNEQGVVFVFALVAEKLGFRVNSIQNPFPDCRATWGKRRIRIEFEFRSRSFETHAHDAKKCDLVVCWKHDWPGMPGGLRVLELRKLLGQAPEVFVVAYNDEFWRNLPRGRQAAGLWSVPATAGPDDLLLVYRPAIAGEEGAITDVFRVNSPVERINKPGWRKEPDWMASIQRVAALGHGIPFSRMRQLGFHGGIESRPNRSKQWPVIYREIQNAAQPSHSLQRWAPVT